MSKVVVCALYKFVRLPKFESLQMPLTKVMQSNQVNGTLLLANEGINGTIAGSRDGIDAVLSWLNQQPEFANIVVKESFTDEIPFLRSKVKLKKEIVTMGVEGIDPLQVVGTYVKPKDWNDLISQDDVILIDTRNDYEFGIGTFAGAVNPKTETFREFPAYVKENLDPAKHKKVAMFCTGGIRCEKSTAYLKEQGFDEVYHLEGGILKYLEEVPQAQSMWQGECFVFDDRVAVNHQLEKGQYDQCNACRLPITEQDKLSPLYIRGVSCPNCHGKHTAEQLERYRQRELQIQIAKSRGEMHIGGTASMTAQQRRQLKTKQKEAQRRKSMAGQAKQGVK